jgi:hypothetical protein
MLRMPRVSARECPPRLRTVLLLTVIAIAPSLSCRATTSGVRAATAILSPQWDSLNIQSLGLVTIGSMVGDEVARQTAEYIVEEQLASTQDRFVVLGVQTARGRAAAAGAGETFDRLVKAWRDERMADKFLVEQLCEKMGVDGLLFGELIDWKREKVDFTQEGSSYTQVALRLVIMSGKTGMSVWEAEKMVRQDTQVYTPGSSGSGVTTDESGISRSQRTRGVTPEPARREDVIVDVLASIMAAFPPRSTK